MRPTFRVDLSRPVTNRHGHTQTFVTLHEPNLGDLISCGELSETIIGQAAIQEVTSWEALKRYLVALSVDVTPEVLLAQLSPVDGRKLVAAISPFIVGGPADSGSPSESSASASA